MGEYDVKRLDVAIKYINRMVSGRNPVSNLPAPENDVLTNPNVNRCLQFIGEVLQDVRSRGGVVGTPARKSSGQEPLLSQIFPYEILQTFRYQQDQQISYFIKQIRELSAGDREDSEGGEIPNVPARRVNDWLRKKGYLEKRMMEDIGKEASVPTEKGAGIGIYLERAGFGRNEYYRIWYNEQAQRFLIDHFREILSETEKAPAPIKQEENRSGGKTGGNEGIPPEWLEAAPGRNSEIPQEWSKAAPGGEGGIPPEWSKEVTGRNGGNPPEWSGTAPGSGGENTAERSGTAPRTEKGSPAKPVEKPEASGEGQDDPALSSLLDSLQGAYGYEPAEDPAGGAGFFGDGWESLDDGLPF